MADDVQFSMSSTPAKDGSGGYDTSAGFSANLPWLKDAANQVLDATGVSSAVGSVLGGEAQAIGGVLKSLGLFQGPAFQQTKEYIDRTTGKTYPSLDALYIGRSTDDYVAKGYPENIAKAIATINQNPSLAPPALKAQLDAFATKAGDTLHQTGDGSTKNYASLLQQMYDTQVGTPALNKVRDDRLKGLLAGASSPSVAYQQYVSEGYPITAAQKQILTDAQTAYVKKTQDAVKADPANAAIVSKYTAPGATPPAAGSVDAVVMAKYTGAPESTVNKLAADWQASQAKALGDGAGNDTTNYNLSGMSKSDYEAKVAANQAATDKQYADKFALQGQSPEVLAEKAAKDKKAAEDAAWLQTPAGKQFSASLTGGPLPMSTPVSAPGQAAAPAVADPAAMAKEQAAQDFKNNWYAHQYDAPAPQAPMPALAPSPVQAMATDAIATPVAAPVQPTIVDPEAAAKEQAAQDFKNNWYAHQNDAYTQKSGAPLPMSAAVTAQPTPAAAGAPASTVADTTANEYAATQRLNAKRAATARTVTPMAQSTVTGVQLGAALPMASFNPTSPA